MGKLSKNKLKALANLSDGQIDTSDIPEIRELPPGYVIGKFYRPKKSPITIRVDDDVLDWLKQSGDGYQTRINEYLRQKMEELRQS